MYGDKLFWGFFVYEITDTLCMSAEVTILSF